MQSLGSGAIVQLGSIEKSVLTGVCKFSYESRENLSELCILFNLLEIRGSQ